MKSVAEALTEILREFERLPAVGVPLTQALGRTLADDVLASTDLPFFDNSAMDGYAIRTADLSASALKVVGEIVAGSASQQVLQAGQAMRIMTGGQVPEGADAVVPYEGTDDDGSEDMPEKVTLQQTVSPGANIRRRGEDVRRGDSLLEAGHILRPQDLGLLAGFGMGMVRVIRAPRVAVMSTGDELLTPEQALVPGKIRDMNSYSLRGMVQAVGAEPLYMGIVQDDYAALQNALQRAVENGADVILSSAGVSVGTRDLVRRVLEDMGNIDFWRVKMRPGKPLAYGHVRGVPYFGLPGNPVSSLASFEVFVRPALLKLLGQPWVVKTVDVVLGEDFESDGRESYIRVTLSREGERLVAHSTGTQSSGAISSLVKAHGLLIIPAGTTHAKAGDILAVRPFAGQPLQA